MREPAKMVVWLQSVDPVDFSAVTKSKKLTKLIGDTTFCPSLTHEQIKEIASGQDGCRSLLGRNEGFEEIVSLFDTDPMASVLEIFKAHFQIEIESLEAAINSIDLRNSPVSTENAKKAKLQILEWQLRVVCFRTVANALFEQYNFSPDTCRVNAPVEIVHFFLNHCGFSKYTQIPETDLEVEGGGAAYIRTHLNKLFTTWNGDNEVEIWSCNLSVDGLGNTVISQVPEKIHMKLADDNGAKVLVLAGADSSTDS